MASEPCVFSVHLLTTLQRVLGIFRSTSPRHSLKVMLIHHFLRKHKFLVFCCGTNIGQGEEYSVLHVVQGKGKKAKSQ